MSYTASQLNELARAIDSDGLALHQDAAEAVARQARDSGVRSSLVGVLADRSNPAPVRERAFGKVVNLLAHADATSSPDWALAN
jgi:hypothetical protein